MRATTNRLFGPEVILPVQFFTTVRRQSPVKTGEVLLLAALLENAIHCYRKHAHARTRHGQRLFREVEEWMMPGATDGEIPTNKTFSFNYVCEVLGLDKDQVRTELAQWRDRSRPMGGRHEPTSDD